MFPIRKLKFENSNNTFKIEDTTTTIEIYALDDDKQVVFDEDDNLEIKIKNSSGYLMTIVPDVTDDSKTVSFSSAQLEKLPVGYYQFELRVNNNAIFPNEGFLSFEITKNATDITGEVISSITLHDFEEKINQLADDLQARADNGDFDGPKGDKGDPGTNTDPNAVHVSGNQAISGVKNFIDTPTVNGNKVLDDRLQIGGRNLIISNDLVNGWIDDLGKATGGGSNPFTTGIIDTGSNQDMTITKAGKVVIIGEYDTDKKFIKKIVLRILTCITNLKLVKKRSILE